MNVQKTSTQHSIRENSNRIFAHVWQIQIKFPFLSYFLVRSHTLNATFFQSLFLLLSVILAKFLECNQLNGQSLFCSAAAVVVIEKIKFWWTGVILSKFWTHCSHRIFQIQILELENWMNSSTQRMRGMKATASQPASKCVYTHKVKVNGNVRHGHAKWVFFFPHN